MEHRIENLPEKKFAGMCTRMSLTKNKTASLFGSFMPLKNTIQNNTGSGVYALEVYDNPDYFVNFNPDNEFTKWAAVEVSYYNDMPNGIQTLILPEGLYAVFHYKGNPGEGAKAYQYIFMNWMPASGYTVDNRPHFALMGEKYKANSADSEEEIWIPVKKK